MHNFIVLVFSYNVSSELLTFVTNTN
jgi:hypothetical protein